MPAVLRVLIDRAHYFYLLYNDSATNAHALSLLASPRHSLVTPEMFPTPRGKKAANANPSKPKSIHAEIIYTCCSAQSLTFSFSSAMDRALFFSALFCSSLAFAAAARSEDRTVCALELILDTLLEGALPLRPIWEFIPEDRGRGSICFGGLDGILNIEGRGLSVPRLSFIRLGAKVKGGSGEGSAGPGEFREKLEKRSWKLALS
jgi:hypothetical protein